MDRGYLDFERLYLVHQSQSWFVIRSKKNTQYQRVYSRKVDKSKGLVCDQKVRLTGIGMNKKYPELIRRIKYIDPETSKRRWELPQTLNEILHIVSVTPFEKMPISSAFFEKNTQMQTCTNSNQLTLFEL
jgi:hypothetical protein